MCGFSGCSVGALFSLALLLKVPIDVIEDVCKKYLLNMKNLLPRPDIAMMWNEYGLDHGNALRSIIHNILRAGGICENITFKTCKV